MNTSGGAIFLPHSPGNVADVSAEVLSPSWLLLWDVFSYLVLATPSRGDVALCQGLALACAAGMHPTLLPTL